MKSFIPALLIAFVSTNAAAADNSFTVALPDLPPQFVAYPSAISALAQVIATQLSEAPRPIGDVSVLIPAQAQQAQQANPETNPEEQQQRAVEPVKGSPNEAAAWRPSLPTIPERPVEAKPIAVVDADKPAVVVGAAPISVPQGTNFVRPEQSIAAGSQPAPVETLPPLGVPILPLGTVGGPSNLPTGAFTINPNPTVTGIVSTHTALENKSQNHTSTTSKTTTKTKSSEETDAVASSTMTTDSNGAAKVTGWGTALGAVFGILALIV